MFGTAGAKTHCHDHYFQNQDLPKKQHLQQQLCTGLYLLSEGLFEEVDLYKDFCLFWLIDLHPTMIDFNFYPTSSAADNSLSSRYPRGKEGYLRSACVS